MDGVSLASRWEDLSKDIAEFEKHVDVLLKKSDSGPGSSSAKEGNSLAAELDKATERLDVILTRFENTFKLSDDGSLESTSSTFNASQVITLGPVSIHVPYQENIYSNPSSSSPPSPPIVLLLSHTIFHVFLALDP